MYYILGAFIAPHISLAKPFVIVAVVAVAFAGDFIRVGVDEAFFAMTVLVATIAVLPLVFALDDRLFALNVLVSHPLSLQDATPIDIRQRCHL
jgi:hypothetical protein